MNYFLTVNGQPPLPCTDLVTTLSQIGEAVARGYFHKDDDAGNSLYIKLGFGSVIYLVSEEAMQEQRRESVAVAQRAQGLIIPGSDKKDDFEWFLVVQFNGGGGQIVQLKPIPYATREAATEAVEMALKGGVIRQVVEPEHDYLWVFPGQNVTYMVMSKGHLEQQQRMALAMQQRAAAAQMGQQLGGMGGPPKKIIRG